MSEDEFVTMLHEKADIAFAKAMEFYKYEHRDTNALLHYRNGYNDGFHNAVILCNEELSKSIHDLTDDIFSEAIRMRGNDEP